MRACIRRSHKAGRTVTQRIRINGLTTLDEISAATDMYRTRMKRTHARLNAFHTESDQTENLDSQGSSKSKSEWSERRSWSTKNDTLASLPASRPRSGRIGHRPHFCNAWLRRIQADLGGDGGDETTIYTKHERFKVSFFASHAQK